VVHKDEVDFVNNVDGNPTIITKKEETTLILLDGETTVIGGISKNTDSGDIAGVPGAKDIPGLGYLFKSVVDDIKLEEMLIFITPHILAEKVAERQE
jgi:type IV pilus assembly protein PilQ